jgi:Uma2 family endonuclease
MRLQINDEYMTYEEFLEYSEIEARFKLEYDNGFIHYMTPVFPNHERVKQRIQLSLVNFLGLDNKCEVFISEVAVCFQQNKDRYQYEPDIMVCCEAEKFDGAIYRGIPGLIVEILSHSTKERDLNTKLNIYEGFGVPEYWIVDISKRQVYVYKDNSTGKYKVNQIFEETDTITWNGMSIKVAFIFEGLK